MEPFSPLGATQSQVGNPEDKSTGGCFEPRLVLSGNGSLEQTLYREPIAAAENDLIFNIGMRNLADQKYRVPTSAVHSRLLSHTCP